MKKNVANFFKEIPEKYINVFSFLVTVSSLLFLFSPFTLITNIFIAVFATNIIFWLPGNFSFAFALLFLIFTMFSIVFKKDTLAENFAILVYYLLLSGVFVEFIQIWLEKILKIHFFHKFFNYIKLNLRSSWKKIPKYKIVIQKVQD